MRARYAQLPSQHSFGSGGHPRLGTLPHPRCEPLCSGTHWRADLPPSVRELSRERAESSAFLRCSAAAVGGRHSRLAGVRHHGRGRDDTAGGIRPSGCVISRKDIRCDREKVAGSLSRLTILGSVRGPALDGLGRGSGELALPARGLRRHERRFRAALAPPLGLRCAQRRQGPRPSYGGRRSGVLRGAQRSGLRAGSEVRLHGLGVPSEVGSANRHRRFARRGRNPHRLVFRRYEGQPLRGRRRDRQADLEDKGRRARGSHAHGCACRA